MGKFTIVILLTVSFLGCGNSDVENQPDEIDTPVVKDGERIKEANRRENNKPKDASPSPHMYNEKNTVTRRGGHKNDEEVTSFDAKVWMYSKNEPPFFPPMLSSDATFYIPKLEEDICKFVPQQYLVEYGSTQAQRTFYIKVYTGYTTVHIWKGVESDCRILKPVKKESCLKISIRDDGKTLACNFNSHAPETWDLTSF